MHLSFHLSLFFYYLIKERDNFNPNDNDLKLKITNQMLLYIINDLYNCPNFTINTNTYLDSKVKNEVKLKDEKQLINKYIYNKIVEVKEKDVYNIINEYIENLMIKTNIKEESKESSRAVLDIKNIVIKRYFI